MTDKEKKYLSDILSSIQLIKTFTKELNSFTAYDNDYLVQAAVERHLGIIGEALNKFTKTQANIEIQNARQIINLRNRLVHSYDNIDSKIIWVILQKHLDPLNEEIDQLLNT